MSSPEFGSSSADPSAQPSTQPTPTEPAPAAKRSRFRSNKNAAPESAPAQAVSVQPEPIAPPAPVAPAYAEVPPPAPIQPMPDTFYSQEVIQQPPLASRAAYLHTAPPNYPAAAPYQPSPAHQAAPAYVSQSATQTWPAIENTLPRDESSLTAEEAAAIAAGVAASRRFRMPKIRMPKVSVPTMQQVKQSIPQVDTKKISWKRIGVVSAALLALMLTIPTLMVVADRAPEAAVVENPEASTLQTLRDKVWNLATLGRGGVNAEEQAMQVVALSINPPVPQVTGDALQAALVTSLAAAEARLAAGQPVLIGVAPGTVVRRVTVKPLVVGEPVVAAQRALIVAAP
ncbi:MAG: hypothetical protein ACRC1H_03580, partial [Caldilineaceae bacterium]